MRASTIAYVGGEWGRADIEAADLVLWMGDPALVCDPAVFAALRRRYPDALIAGCSSPGGILDGETLDGGAAAAVISFDKVRVAAVERPIPGGGDPAEVGRALAAGLPRSDLAAVCLLVGASVHPPPFATPGIFAGLVEALPPGVALFGGGAGDGAGMAPAAGLDRAARPAQAVAIGFYGEAFRFGFGAGAGWDPLGPVRRVTRAEGPAIYEFDNQPALDVYLRYAGLEAQAFRISNARFPFTFWDHPGAEGVVRPVGGIDEQARALLAIEDVPVGAAAQMMHCCYDRLIDAGALAAKRALAAAPPVGLAFVASCVARRAAMGQYIAEETQALADELRGLPMIGFYAYGEFGAHARTGRPFIHTHSVAVAVLGEAA